MTQLKAKVAIDDVVHWVREEHALVNYIHLYKRPPRPNIANPHDSHLYWIGRADALRRLMTKCLHVDDGLPKKVAETLGEPPEMRDV